MQPKTSKEALILASPAARASAANAQLATKAFLLWLWIIAAVAVVALRMVGQYYADPDADSAIAFVVIAVAGAGSVLFFDRGRSSGLHRSTPNDPPSVSLASLLRAPASVNAGSSPTALPSMPANSMDFAGFEVGIVVLGPVRRRIAADVLSIGGRQMTAEIRDQLIVGEPVMVECAAGSLLGQVTSSAEKTGRRRQVRIDFEHYARPVQTAPGCFTLDLCNLARAISRETSVVELPVGPGHAHKLGARSEAAAKPGSSLS